MLTDTKISDRRTITLDIEPMTVEQQTVMATAIADFLVRSGQVRTDVALSPVQLIQFLSEAADMAQQQATPVDPDSVEVFTTRDVWDTLVTPEEFLTKRELDGNFDDCCNALHTVNEAMGEDHTVANAFVLLLNRAHWLGQGRCAPFHLTPRS